MSELLTAALAWAEAGRRVFPVVPGRKAPLTRRGLHDATTDIERLTYWWTEVWPDANVGLPTGDGLVVIDVDPGGHVPDTCPATLMAKTPRGGCHLYYSTPYKIPNSVSKIAPHVDVRGEGGYVLVAPSVVDGRAYEFAWLMDPAELPEPVVREAQRHSTPGPRGPASLHRAGFEPRDRVSEGGRNDYIARFTGHALRLLDDALTFPELLELIDLENRAVCVPPLPDPEVERTVRSIWRRHHGG